MCLTIPPFYIIVVNDILANNFITCNSLLFFIPESCITSFLYFCRLKQQPNPEVLLMEKRIGTITILVLDRSVAPTVNNVISDNAEIVLARQGLPFQHRNVAVISLIVEGTVNEINTLSGKLGRIDHVEVKVAVTKLA